MICEHSKCTACGSCIQICPVHCIEFKEYDGERYPIINEDKCINCDLCKRHCPSLQKVNLNDIQNAYAAYANADATRLSCASGGAFTCLAENILGQGGIVFGSSMNPDLSIEHICVARKEDLNKIKGSKYVYSDGKDCYQLAKEALKRGRKVLYSGTPCQIAGLYSYLGKDYAELTTVDLVCHGTPPYKLFYEYIKDFEKEKKCSVLEYKFRSHMGHRGGCFGELTYKSKKTVTKPLLWNCDSYYCYFMYGVIYIENCYTCPYAQRKRVADITLGDFWGIEHIISGARAGNVSLVLINTEKGKALLNETQNMKIISVDVESAVRHNGQLNHPMEKPIELRNRFYNLYSNGGWRKVRLDFYSRNKKIRMASWVAFYTPDWIKKILHRIREK
jgi:coenzyme F420-reducing hydrogenase beta subunit